MQSYCFTLLKIGTKIQFCLLKGSSSGSVFKIVLNGWGGGKKKPELSETLFVYKFRSVISVIRVEAIQKREK